MANLTETSNFDDVYQIETSDKVLGGSGGIANRQAQQLLNRTKYLKDGKHIAAASDKAAIVDADKIAIIDTEASNALKTTTWANIKAKVFAALGALIAGGTAKTTPADADTLALSDSEATNATKKLSIANLAANFLTRLGALIAAASAKATLADADVLLIGDSAASNATKKIPASLLARRTKMPDGATPLWSNDAWDTIDSFSIYSSSVTLSKDLTPGALRITRVGTGLCQAYRVIVGMSGKYLHLRYRQVGTEQWSVRNWGNAGTPFVCALLPKSTDWNTVLLPIQIKEDFPNYNGLAFRSDTGADGNYLEIDWGWIGDISYLDGTISEDGAKLINELALLSGLPVYATATLTSSTLANFTDDKKITIHGKAYTAKTTLGTTEGQFLIGATYVESLINLARCVLHTGTPGTDYYSAAAHPLVTAVNTSGAILTLTAKVAGESGNYLTLTTDEPTLTVSGATFTGGKSKVAAIINSLVSLPTGYATLLSPAFTGAPTAPTAVAGTNTTQIATTAFVTAAIAAAVAALTSELATGLIETDLPQGAGSYPAGVEVGDAWIDTTAGGTIKVRLA